MFTEQELIDKLNYFRNLPSENEWFEFKDANDNFKTDKIGKYFSALSNEANILEKDFAWLIFGVHDKTHKIIGTDYRVKTERLHGLKKQIADNITDRISFANIHVITVEGNRVIMFQIPPAPRGTPIAWKGHWFGREHESLVSLSQYKLDKIRNQRKFDWSGQIVDKATIEDLDAKAIEYATKKFKEGSERSDFYDEIDSWDTTTFLNKAKLTINGKITNTALLLLGKSEAKHYLFPNARITYVYINENGDKADYEHFDPPFILKRDNLLKRLKQRNSKFKILPSEETLNPIEIFRYDNWVILEALNNCIAHQDYSKQEKIIVTETANYELTFKSTGRFYYGAIEDYIFLKDFTPNDYRNPFLAEAMESVGMIDTVGSGIRRIFIKQKERYLPLPEYVLGNYVEITIFSDNVRNSYTEKIFSDKNIDIGIVFLLDKRQKGYPIDDNDYKYAIISFLKQKRRAGRTDIDDLLLNEIDDELDIEQKRTKIRNLLYSLSSDGKIKNISTSTKKPIWTLA
jgi:ATP-dependent DNA helicase RecG